MAKPMNMRGGKGQMRGGPRPKAKKGTLKRVLGMLFARNKGYMSIVFVCITISAITGVTSSVFLRKLLELVDQGIKSSYSAVLSGLITLFITMGTVYLTSIICNFIQTRTMATVTQSFLHQIRTSVFNKMQSLPIRYFDTHLTGDIMSSYTNDTDALRQLVSQSIPSLYSSLISVTTLLVIMFTSSIWLSLVIFLGIVIMFIVTKTVGGNSAKYFVKQQVSLGAEEGYVQ